MFSFSLQKQQLLSHFHLLFSRLSFVKMTPFCRYRRKIFIFRGTFNFHTMLLVGTILVCIKSVYIDLTENLEFLFKSQIKVSVFSVSTTFSTLKTKGLFGRAPPLPASAPKLLCCTILHCSITKHSSGSAWLCLGDRRSRWSWVVGAYSGSNTIVYSARGGAG